MKIVIPKFRFLCCTIERFLSNQAKHGKILKKVKGWIWEFENSDPKDIAYIVLFGGYSGKFIGTESIITELSLLYFKTKRELDHIFDISSDPSFYVFSIDKSKLIYDIELNCFYEERNKKSLISSLLMLVFSLIFSVVPFYQCITRYFDLNPLIVVIVGIMLFMSFCNCILNVWQFITFKIKRK